MTSSHPKFALITAAMIALVTSPLAAWSAEPVASLHPTGVLRLVDTRLLPGSTVRLTGEKFAKGGELELLLVGIDGRVAIATVRADSVGKFVTDITLPEALSPGSYSLVAIASDGDTAGRLEVMVVAAPIAQEPVEAESETHDPSHEPTADPMVLDRATSAAVTGGAAIGVLLAFGVGVFTLYRSRNGR